jgi:hypothetical protein
MAMVVAMRGHRVTVFTLERGVLEPTVLGSFHSRVGSAIRRGQRWAGCEMFDSLGRTGGCPHPLARMRAAICDRALGRDRILGAAEQGRGGAGSGEECTGVGERFSDEAAGVIEVRRLDARAVGRREDDQLCQL